MRYFNHHKILLIALSILLVCGLSLLIVVVQRQQDVSSHAEKSTTLSFTPTSTQNSPIAKNVGDQVPLDIIVQPGTNLVTVVHLVMTFDQNILQADQANPFTANAAAFPTIIEGPFISPGKVSVTLSIGSDPTKAISTETKAGTLNLIAMAPTGVAATKVTIVNTTSANTSEVLSSGVGDQATENVLNTVVPAYVLIEDANTQGNGLDFTVHLLLHGIGHSGDNANPTAFSLSNQHPLRPTRPVEVQIFSGNNHQLIATASGTANYNELTGDFVGTASATTKLTPGQYILKVRSDRYLRKVVPGFSTITTASMTINLPQLSLVTSDSNNDNKLNILDYNMILDCYTGTTPARSCDEAAKKLQTDANDDGSVNQYDYNLFLRELSVQSGD